MRWLFALVALVLGAGCKGKAKGPAAGEVKIDWTACEQALDKAKAAPLDARPQIVIDGCRVCGADWKPILSWNLEPEHGGPKREQIEQMTVACHAFCTGDSKLKFMSAVDKVRGQNVDMPWRLLENACKDKVNGAADDRFMSAPFFALDRIARLAAKHGEPIAGKLTAIELPLPAATVSGAGVVLPEVEGVSPNIGTLAITVLGDSIHVGQLPRGKLTHAGVAVDFGKAGYPGDAVPLDQLAARLTALVGGDKTQTITTQTITLLAPQAMPAAKLVDIIAAAAPVAPVFLAAKAVESPEGWQLPGAIPIALEAGDAIAVTSEMTVQNLARELAARAARKEPRVGVTKR